MKSIILCVFASIVLIFVCSVDSLNLNGWAIFLTLIVALGTYILKNFSEEDYFKYSGYNFICEKLGWDPNKEY